MTRRLTVLFATLEALLVAAIGVAIPLVALTAIWVGHFGFGPDWTVFWRASVDVWLLGHGVDVTFTLDPSIAVALGLPAAGDPVKITIALLGFALLTLLLGARAGGRVAETGHRLLGGCAAFVAFAVVSLIITLSALHPLARPSLWQGIILPAGVFGVGLVIGVVRAGRDRHPGAGGSSVRDWIDDWRPDVRAGVVASFKAGIGAVAVTAAVASVLIAVLFVVHFTEMIGLYETLHTEVIGGVALTAGQVAVLPNLVIWAMSWLIGPGFAIGAGSHVSALGTALGPLPAIPVLGALPTSDLPFGFVGILVPVVAAFLTGVAVRPALARALDGYVSARVVVVVAVGSGLVGGLLLGFLAAASGGSAGPGRLAVVGPDPIAVGLIAALEFAVATAIGLAAAGRLPRRR
ncbi:MAG: DUF6350 family protein [Pseudolysinimonas sp.]|uniref:cell division protein PerM n=1 Tax=Pseudolysinimonas sp. TaxID=2680009 RepID=UPI00326767F5